MSLKWFHVLFITLSFALAVGVGIWGLRSYSMGGARSELIIGVLSLMTAVVIVVYGRWFLRKAERFHLE